MTTVANIYFINCPFFSKLAQFEALIHAMEPELNIVPIEILHKLYPV
jgi:hypothetical protein